MSDYEPFEAAQGDPWSTEPVGDYPRQKREPDPETYQDESQVLARVPHVGDESATEQYRQYGHSGNSHRRHRSPTRRPGIPAPVWVAVGMVLVAVIATPLFLISNNSGDDTALEMPAPNADMAPTWSPDDASSQWEQPSAWTQEAVPGATVAAEPTASGAWNTGADWVGAPPNAPYANNAADTTAQMPVAQDGRTPGPEMTPLGGQTPSVGWGNNPATAGTSPPIEPGYQAMGATSQPGYPATANEPTAPWSTRDAAPVASPQPSFGTTQPTPNARTWDQAPPTRSLATPQPENVMPGYGTTPAAQLNPYVGPSHTAVPPRGNYAGTYPAAPSTPQQYPSFAPNYPVAGQPTAPRYPASDYPQTAMSPKPATPTTSLPTRGAAAYPSQPLAPSGSYPPAARNPYVPPAAQAAPAGQPYYGTGASTEASQRSVARLNGTIQEPAARAAHNDRARPSYY
jgi:hypothetical protein